MAGSQNQSKTVWIIVVIALCALAGYVFVFGGITIRGNGWRLSSRDPMRPLLVAAVVVGFARWRRGADGFRQDLASFPERLRLRDQPAVWLGVVTLGLGLLFCTRVAGGADAYGYVSQAQFWAAGQVRIPQPLAVQVPWPSAEWTFAPLGYRPAPTPGAIVPVYPPGLPLLMAAVSYLHPGLVFVVVPLSGAIAVVLSFHLGRAAGGRQAGLLTAALVATSPVFLYQLMWPMSDVPVAASWTAALVLALRNRPLSWLGAGLVSSIAVLIRPNTVPLGAALAVVAAFSGRFGGERTWRAAFVNPAFYLSGILPGGVATMSIHSALYGSPLQSGYGHVAELYSLAYGGTNVRRYVTWLVGSETPFVLIALVAVAAMWRSRRQDSTLIVTVLYTAVAWLCYMFYRPFGDWWYLRFLLPALPVMLALAAAGFLVGLSWLRPRFRTPAAALVLIAVLALRVEYAVTNGVFRLWQIERRYVETGTFVRLYMPENAIFISMQQSGSLRYYSNRSTLRWDLLEPAWLDRSIGILKGLGLEPYLLLEDQEESFFRGRFAGASRLGRLNWKARVELPTDPVVRIYYPEDAW